MLRTMSACPDRGSKSSTAHESHCCWGGWTPFLSHWLLVDEAFTRYTSTLPLFAALNRMGNAVGVTDGPPLPPLEIEAEPVIHVNSGS